MKKNLEELEILGYTVIEGVLSSDELVAARAKITAVNIMQKQEMQNHFDITQIAENNIARMPFVYDSFFYSLLNNAKIIPYIREILGEYFILQTQNGVLVDPNLTHSQNKWHRDFSHMNFVSDPVLAVNAFFCITDFNLKTGATCLLPHSHKINYKPSAEYMEKHGIHMELKAGSVFLFNTMMFHKTGLNVSEQTRIGINHLYTKYILKQQIDIPALLEFKTPDDSFMSMLLGFDSRVATSILDYRLIRKSSSDKKLNELEKKR
jgi:ectoine hydroxylase-related dioxygenase (phytanoyl-CoA dioxygenase family)